MNRRVRTLEVDPQQSAETSLKDLRSDLQTLYVPPGEQLATDYQTEEDEVNAVLAEAGGAEGGGAVVYRKKSPQSGKYEWLGKCPSGEFVALGGVAYLAGKFGGGDYELIVYGSDNRIIKRPKLTISSAAIAELKTPDARGNGDLSQLISAMQDGFKQMAQLVTAQAAPRETKADWLNEMRAMRELFGNAQPQSNPLDMLTKLIPAIRELVPRDGDTNLLDVMLNLAREFGPALKDAIQKMPIPAPVPPAASVSLPLNPGGHSAAPQSPEQIGANQMSTMLKMQLEYLCNEAKRDSDPGPYAALIVDKIPREVLNNLVNKEEWLNELSSICSTVKLFPQWFTELREAVIEIMTEPDEQNPGNLTDPENQDISRETTD